MHLLGKLGGERLFSELVQILREKEPTAAIGRMATLGLLPFIHPALKLAPATERVLNEAGQVMAWFRLLYLDDPCEQWQVYFLAMFDGLKPDEFTDACRRLSVPGRFATQLHNQRCLVHKTLDAIKRRMKNHANVRNSELFSWFSVFSLEMLLYLASRASSEQVRRFVSFYLTRLRGVVPLLDGQALLELGLQPGPGFGRVKERLMRARLDGEVQSREDELALVRTLVP